jgi:hypothetical protein
VVRHDGLYRRFISAAFNTSFRLLFGGGVRDVNSKPKIIRRDKYELLDLKSDDWFIDAELVPRELGLKIGEIRYISGSTTGARLSSDPRP